ncbi:MAG: IS1595 family transposase [Gallionella sp.]
MNDLLNPIFIDEEKAREHLEALRWSKSRVCPHCGECENTSPTASKNHKPGLYYCNSCEKTFTVTVGTLFERSHIPLNKWLMAFHLMASSKKGISSHQLHRTIGVTYKTAWFMAHRIREAMDTGFTGPLGSTGSPVEVDETYWGNQGKQAKGARGFAHKMKVVSLVERNGQKRSFHVANVTAKTVTPILRKQVAKNARLMTDETRVYNKVGKEFASHEKVNHSAGEYSRGDVTTNTAESSFAILKRGLYGIFHHVSEQHLQRYATEFDFKWNHRSKLGFSDADRATVALKNIGGKRLMYRRIDS